MKQRRNHIRALVDLGAAGGVEAGRLERALALRVRRLAAGRYHVEGGREDHWVDLYTTRLPRCDCGDHLWRERVCKHILAVLLREGDERVIGEVARLVEALRRSARELERETRRRRKPGARAA